MRVPCLQVAVDDAVAGIWPHDRPARVVRGLIRHDGEVLGPRTQLVLGRVHGLDDVLELREQITRHLMVVVGAVIGHAQQRPAERVLIDRIDVEIVLVIGVDRALRVEVDHVVVPLDCLLLPFRAPARCLRGNIAPPDRRCRAAAASDVAAAEESEARMVERLAVEIVEDHRVARRAHIGIELLVLQEGRAVGFELIAIILAEEAFAGLGVVGLADARIEHHVGIAHDERGKDDEVSRLLVLLAGLHVGVEDAGDLLCLLVVDQFGHEGAHAERKFRLVAQHRHDVEGGGRF